MTYYQIGQLVLAGVVVVLVAVRARSVWYDAAIEAKPVQLRVVALISSGDFEAVRVLADRLPRSAWLARVLQPTAAALPDIDTAEIAVDESLAELKSSATEGLLALRVLTSVATTLGLLGAVLQLSKGATPDHSLAALEAGLPQRMAFSNAITSMALGIATAIVCGVSLRMLKRDAVRQFEEARSLGRAMCSELARVGGRAA